MFKYQFTICLNKNSQQKPQISRDNDINYSTFLKKKNSLDKKTVRIFDNIFILRSQLDSFYIGAKAVLSLWCLNMDCLEMNSFIHFVMILKIKAFTSIICYINAFMTISSWNIIAKCNADHKCAKKTYRCKCMCRKHKVCNAFCYNISNFASSKFQLNIYHEYNGEFVKQDAIKKWKFLSGGMRCDALRSLIYENRDKSSCFYEWLIHKHARISLTY